MNYEKTLWYEGYHGYQGVARIAWDESNLMNCKKLSDKLYDTKDIMEFKGLMEIVRIHLRCK